MEWTEFAVVPGLPKGIGEIVPSDGLTIQKNAPEKGPASPLATLTAEKHRPFSPITGKERIIDNKLRNWRHRLRKAPGTAYTRIPACRICVALCYLESLDQRRQGLTVDQRFYMPLQAFMTFRGKGKDVHACSKAIRRLRNCVAWTETEPGSPVVRNLDCVPLPSISGRRAR